MKRYLIIFFFLTCFYVNATEEKKPIRVYADIVGDLFHAGHISFLKKARSLGDYLIVGIISDELVTDYKREPIFTHDERAAVIRACKYVDEVYLHCPLGVTEELLDDLDIDLVVHGDDFDEAKAREQYLPAIQKGIFRFVPCIKGISTTGIIERIANRIENSLENLVKKDFFEGTKAAKQN